MRSVSGKNGITCDQRFFASWGGKGGKKKKNLDKEGREIAKGEESDLGPTPLQTVVSDGNGDTRNTLKVFA